MAPNRERGQSPMGRTPLPATVMNVKLCCAKCEEKAKEECEEVEGVVKVVTDQGENKVIVYGMADPSALLKKMRRHLDKHAMYWLTDDANPAAPPLFPVPVDTREGIGPPLHTGTVLPTADPRDRGPPLADSREILHERDLPAAAESREIRPGSPHHVVREVVFVDAKDGTPVNPRNVRKLDPAASPPRDGPRNFGVDARDLVDPVERMELRGGDSNHGPAPREVVVVPVEAVKDHPPRDGHGLGELREVRRVHDLRDHGPPAHDVRSVGPGMIPVDNHIRPVDPRSMMRNPAPPPREPVLDRGRVRVPEGLMPVRTGRDAREVQFAPAGAAAGQRLSPRGPRDAEYRSPRQHHPDRGPRSPRRDPAPCDCFPGADHVQAPRSPRFEPPRSPGRGRDDYDPRPRPTLDRELSFIEFGPGPAAPPAVPLPYEPRDAAVAAAPASFDFHAPGRPRSPRPDHEPQVQVRGYGDIDPLPRPRNPRPDHEPQLQVRGYGDIDPLPRSPRSTDREVRGYGDIDPLQHPRSPRPDHEPQVQVRGYGDIDPLQYPRSPRPDHEPQVQVRGYGDIDPRQFRPAAAADILHSATTSPRGIRPVQRYGTDVRDVVDASLYRSSTRADAADGGPVPPLSPRSPRYYNNSEPPTFRGSHDDSVRGGEYYEPKESYFSDYHPSQNYQPGPLATQDIDALPATNPNYKKHIFSDPTF